MSPPTFSAYTTHAGSAPSIRQLGWPDDSSSQHPGKVSIAEDPESNDPQPEYVAIDLPDVRVSFTENAAGEMNTGSLIKIKSGGKTALFEKIVDGIQPLNDEAEKLKKAWNPLSPGLPLAHGIRLQVATLGSEKGIGLTSIFVFPEQEADAPKLSMLTVDMEAHSPALVTESFNSREGDCWVYRNLEMELRKGEPAVAPTWQKTQIYDDAANLTTTHRLDEKGQLVTEIGPIS